MEKKMTLVHPGEILKMEIVEGKKLTVTDAAVVLRTTRANLSNILNGKAAISPAMAVKMEHYIGGSARLWLQLQTTYDLSIAEKEFSAV